MTRRWPGLADSRSLFKSNVGINDRFTILCTATLYVSPEQSINSTADFIIWYSSLCNTPIFCAYPPYLYSCRCRFLAHGFEPAPPSAITCSKVDDTATIVPLPISSTPPSQTSFACLRINHGPPILKTDVGTKSPVPSADQTVFKPPGPDLISSDRLNHSKFTEIQSGSHGERLVRSARGRWEKHIVLISTAGHGFFLIWNYQNRALDSALTMRTGFMSNTDMISMLPKSSTNFERCTYSQFCSIFLLRILIVCIYRKSYILIGTTKINKD